MTEMTREQMLAQIAALQAQNTKLAAAATAARTDRMTLKVGQSGTLCLYHGARYPIALYREQWERIIPFIKSGKVEEFIRANSALLKTRED